MRTRFTLTATALLVMLAARPAGADRDDDHDRAREALRCGEVRPLVIMLEELGDRLASEIVAVEFEADGGRFVYEFEVVSPSGRLEEVVVDAASGRILEREEEDDD